MHWFRNREFRTAFLTVALIGLVCTVLCAFFSWESALIAAAATFSLLLAEYLFARRRYRNIAELSEYLKRVNSGRYELEVQNHDEGELSILKSEIYKATVTLCVQTETLRNEKAGLADSLSDISHQLKTPLTSMTVMTDLLCDPALPDAKRKEFTGMIRNQLERIEWLVTSLLKLSRFDAGTITFKKVLIPVEDLLRKATAPLQIPIELRKQKLIVDGAGISLLCDLNWTAEAILNIVKNCVEHTPVGGEIRIHCFQNALYTQILISDNGSGILPEDLPHIFERFYRGKNAGEDSVGIGLAMAKSMITSQGGSIGVDSKAGEGTAFTIRFFG